MNELRDPVFLFHDIRQSEENAEAICNTRLVFRQIR